MFRHFVTSKRRSVVVNKKQPHLVSISHFNVTITGSDLRTCSIQSKAMGNEGKKFSFSRHYFLFVTSKRNTSQMKRPNIKMNF